MIKDFEEVMQQLSELSEVVNKFKSEAVQLSIVELVFAGASPSNDEVQDDPADDPAPTRRRKKKKAANGQPRANSENKKARAPGKGPKPTLEQFIAEGFFNQKRTIGAIVAHCKLKARIFKNNELSGPLGRLVRDEQLTRTTNAENQFEYIKK